MTVDVSAATDAGRNLEWIKQELQTAIAVEAGTLPPYLAALFSLEVQNYTAYNLIRSVAMEEMVHMAIAANTLAALGAVPRIKSLELRYPMRGLPGGAEPDLEIGLARLSRPQLAHFMRIERPAFLLSQAYEDEEYPTIGKLYGQIEEAIRANAAAVRDAVRADSPAHQVGDNIGFATIVPTPGLDPVDQLIDGIALIVEQGEGTSRESLFAGDRSEDEESHYARFAELYYGAKYDDPQTGIELRPETEPDFFRGRPVPWPKVINTLAVPTDGYRRVLELDPNDALVTADLEAFDAAYSEILASLDAVWNGPAEASWKTLGSAVRSMVSLRVLSCFNIMRHQVPSDVVPRIPDLYPDESEYLAAYTDLDKPVFYGPRFRNTNI